MNHSVTICWLPKLPRWLALAIGVCALAASGVAQTTATGTVEGRVFDPRRGEYLENARLTVDGTTLEILTDATGAYRLARVPAGAAKVRIFYTGLGTQTETINVIAGQTVQRDITITAPSKGTTATGDVVRLGEFVVSTSKEMDGSAIAINEQRFAKSIISVVSADEFGTIADGSIGEFMKFLPGITSDYTGGDARRFSIGGAPSDNVPISMGGFEMASAAGAGSATTSRRAVELDQVSINNIARIEINRSPTPDTPGAALTGSVNFVPRSAFERNKPSYSYSVSWLMKDGERSFGRQSPGPGWGQMSYKIHPGFDISAVVPVSKTFGFTVSAGTSLQYTMQPNTAMQWRGAATGTTVAANITTGLPATTPDNPYLGTFSWRDSGKNTYRESFSTTVDWKPARYDRLSFGFSYGMLREHFATRTQTFTINRVMPGNWGPDHTWGQFSTFPATGTAINAGQFSLSNGGRIRPGRTYSPSLRWLHEGRVWKSDAGFSYGNSRIHYQDIDKGFFNGLTVQRNNVSIRFDDIYYLRPGRITVLDPRGNPVDPTKLENYSLVSANSNRQRTYDTVRQAYANVRRDFMVRDIPVTVKVGADLRNKIRDMRGPGGNLETYTYVGPDGRASTTPTTQAGLINDDSPLAFLDTAYSERIPNFGLPKQQQVDNGKLWQHYVANPTYWTRNAATEYTAVTNLSRHAEELISTLYLRGDIALLNHRLKLVGGLRAEQTNIDAEGPLNDPTLAYQRDANGTVVRGTNGAPILIVPTTAGLPYSQLTLIDRGYKAKKEYLRLFPSLNVSYNVTDSLIARAAYYETVGRPDFYQYFGGLTLPNTELFNPNDRITVSNVSIKAWQAKSYMMRFEYYFGGVGQLVVGGFIRDYTNAFMNVTSLVTPEFLGAYGLAEEDYGMYNVVTQFNSPGVVRMKGFEVEYRQALSFLPNWARGVQFFANISSQRARGTDSFPDMNPFTANWGLSLTRPKFNIRINENYRGVQRRALVATTATNSIEPGTYNYIPKRLYVDVTGEYYLRRNLGLFFALRNIGGATEDTKIYGPHTPLYARFRQRDDYGALWTAGVKGSF